MSQENKSDSNVLKESVLKKRRRDEEFAAKRAIQHAAKLRKIQGKHRKVNFIRAEQLVQEYRDRVFDMNRFESDKAMRDYELKQENVLGFAIRLHTRRKLHAKSIKVLNQLKLKGINEGRFFKVTEEVAEMLDCVKPYVVWGYPSYKTVKELIYKRGQGYGQSEEEVVPLTDNAWIEERMGAYNVICIEDLIHEIYSVGENFEQVNAMLCPFKLSIARDEIDGKYKKSINIGRKGNREQEIDEIISKMN